MGPTLLNGGLTPTSRSICTRAAFLPSLRPTTADRAPLQAARRAKQATVTAHPRPRGAVRRRHLALVSAVTTADWCCGHDSTPAACSISRLAVPHDLLPHDLRRCNCWHTLPSCILHCRVCCAAGVSSESPGCSPDINGDDKRSPVPIGRVAGEGQCVVPPWRKPSPPDC